MLRGEGDHLLAELREVDAVAKYINEEVQVVVAHEKCETYGIRSGGRNFERVGRVLRS